MNRGQRSGGRPGPSLRPFVAPPVASEGPHPSAEADSSEERSDDGRGERLRPVKEAQPVEQQGDADTRQRRRRPPHDAVHPSNLARSGGRPGPYLVSVMTWKKFVLLLFVIAVLSAVVVVYMAIQGEFARVTG